MDPRVAQPSRERAGGKAVRAKLSRLLRSSPEHRTRLHTTRGDLVLGPVARDVPRIALGRLRGRQPDGVWFNQPARDYLAEIIRPQWTVLECGAGRSTVWLAEHAARITSLESSPAWYEQVLEMTRGYAHVTVELHPGEELPRRISDAPDDAYDLVLVDNDEAGVPAGLGRPACVAAARTKVRPGGWLVLDNSERPGYSTVEHILYRWPRKRFVGVPWTPLVPTETTFFQRPL